MPDHVHLIVRPRLENHDIEAIRKAIKAPVGRNAIAFLKEHRPDWLDRLARLRGSKREHLIWQSGGGYDRNIENPKTLERMLDYIHMNPVRAGIVDFAEAWKWSSARWYLSHEPTPLRLDPIPPEWTS